MNAKLLFFQISEEVYFLLFAPCTVKEIKKVIIFREKTGTFFAKKKCSLELRYNNNKQV